jgi:hypothetical protein
VGDIKRFEIAVIGWVGNENSPTVYVTVTQQVAICSESDYNILAMDIAFTIHSNDAMIAKTGVGGKDGFNGRTKQSPGGKTKKQARQRGN